MDWFRVLFGRPADARDTTVIHERLVTSQDDLRRKQPNGANLAFSLVGFVHVAGGRSLHGVSPQHCLAHG